MSKTEKWILYGGLALLAVLFISRSSSSAGKAPSTASLTSLFGPFSNAFSAVRGWFTTSVGPNGGGGLTQIPTPGGVLPGSPVFGPDYDPSQMDSSANMGILDNLFGPGNGFDAYA